MEILGKAKGPSYPIFRDLDLLVQIHLTAVRLIRDTDHIAPLGQQLRVLGKFMNRGEKDPAAVPSFQQFSEMGPTLHTDHRRVPDVSLAIGKETRELVIQVSPVGDQDDGRARQIHTLHQQTNQEQHSKALPAARRPKVGAALAIAFGPHMPQNILIELGGRVVLRIPAEYLLFLPGGVGQINKVADHVAEAGRVKEPLDHRIERVYSVFFDQIAAIGLAPAVEEFIGREERTRLVVHPVTDHTEGIIFKEFRDVAFVAHRQLDKGIVNRRLLPDRALKFKDHQRQPVDVEDPIRYPLLVSVNLQLIHHLEDVADGSVARIFLSYNRRHLARLRFPKSDQVRIIDQLYIEVFLSMVFTL